MDVVVVTLPPHASSTHAQQHGLFLRGTRYILTKPAMALRIDAEWPWQQWVAWLATSIAGWLLVCAVHTLFVAWHRRADKTRLGIPRTVQLPLARRERELALARTRVLPVLDALVSELDIPTWAVFGTALGIARHNGRIPWDDDFDVALWVDDWPAVQTWLAQNGVRYGVRLGMWWKWMGSCAKLHDIHTGADLCDLFPVRHNPLTSFTELAWPSLQRARFNANIRCASSLLRSVTYPRDTNGRLEDWPRAAHNPYLVTIWFGEDAMDTAVINAPHHPLLWLATVCNPFLCRRFTIRHKHS